MTGIDLAARWLGGSVLAASDESFGFKEHLLVPGEPRFEPGRYDHRGEIVDGWETRRRRSGSADWALVRLGAPGRIDTIDVDTRHFTGNHPETARVEALAATGYPGVAALCADDAPWYEIVPATPIAGDSHNLLRVSDACRFTHLRLTAAPDGGIARLRVFGAVIPDPAQWDGVTVQLSSVAEGGRVVRASDDFYSSAAQLIRPDTPLTMGDGWETARRRSGSADVVVLRLGAAGRLCRAEVDTTHFKYNASAVIEMFGTVHANPAEADGGWTRLLGRTALQPDTRHVFVIDTPEVSTVRVTAFPDGGIARLRLWGTPAVQAVAVVAGALRAARPERILETTA